MAVCAAIWLLLVVPLLAQDLAQTLNKDLVPRLSRGCFISREEPPRWSTYNDPEPLLVVNVQSEADVALTVQVCNALNVPFLAQNGGNGWADTFNLTHRGIIINIAALNQISVSPDKQSVSIGGGVKIRDVIPAAADAGVLLQTGNCNCVGALGAYLGGGYGNLIGLLGYGVDNILSMRVVTAEGKIITASASSNPDYYWALRGAGPNFGIVTSAVLKAYPTTPDQQLAWTGGLIFTPDKLEQVVQAIENLDLKPEMNVFMYFISSGPPTNQPVILTTPFLYKGTNATGRAAFASLYEIGPVADTTTVLPWQQWNAGAEGFCTRGGRKPSFGAGLQKLYPDVWRQIWNQYVDFQRRPGAENSVVLVESYNLDKARANQVPAAFPHRNVNYIAVAINWYPDPSLDAEALRVGRSIRDLWRRTDELPLNDSYINYAHGDEPLTAIYGESLPRLRELKQRLDPKNRFNQWFNIR